MIGVVWRMPPPESLQCLLTHLAALRRVCDHPPSERRERMLAFYTILDLAALMTIACGVITLHDRFQR